MVRWVNSSFAADCSAERSDLLIAVAWQYVVFIYATSSYCSCYLRELQKDSSDIWLHTLPYSAKFSRRIIFAVYVDSSRTAKIKLFETFRLNFPGVCGIVWKRYSTFAVLRGRPKHMEKFCVGLEIVLTRCKLLIMSLTPAHIKQTCELKKLTPVSYI